MEGLIRVRVLKGMRVSFGVESHEGLLIEESEVDDGEQVWILVEELRICRIQ